MAVTDYVENLKAERDRAWGEQRAVLDTALAEKRSTNAEENQTVARTDEAIDRIDTEIRSWIERDRRDRDAGTARDGFDAVLRPEHRSTVAGAEAQQNAEVLAFLRGERRSIEIDLAPAANAASLMRSGAGRSEFRDYLVSSAASAGTLVPTTFSSQLYEYMESISGVRKASPTVITTSGGEPMSFPKVATYGTAAIVGEGTALAEVDATFGLVTLGSYKYGQLVQVSSEMLTDTSVDLLGFVARDTGRALGRATNTAYTSASGTNAPQGFVVGSLLGGTGVVSQTGATGVPSYADIVSLLFSVADEAYADQGAVLMTKWANLAALRKLVDTQNRPLWEPSLQAGAPSTLLGYPVLTNPAMAAWSTAATQNTMAFGNFTDGFIIRDVGSVRFERSDDFAFSSDLVTFRAILRTDSKVRDSGALKVMRAPTT